MIRDRAYLDYLRTVPCVLTGRMATDCEAVDPCHIGTAGKGLKSPDDEALPILHSLHVEMHQKGEIETLRRLAPVWLLRMAFRALAREFYRDWKEKQAA